MPDTLVQPVELQVLHHLNHDQPEAAHLTSAATFPARVTGIIARTWFDAPYDYARLLVLLQPAETPLNRMYHLTGYITLCLPFAHRSTTSPTNLSGRLNSCVRVTGQLDHRTYTESLAQFLRRIGLPERIRERDHDCIIHHSMTILMVETLTRLD